MVADILEYNKAAIEFFTELGFVHIRKKSMQCEIYGKTYNIRSYIRKLNRQKRGHKQPKKWQWRDYFPFNLCCKKRI